MTRDTLWRLTAPRGSLRTKVNSTRALSVKDEKVVCKISARNLSNSKFVADCQCRLFGNAHPLILKRLDPIALRLLVDVARSALTWLGGRKYDRVRMSRKKCHQVAAKQLRQVFGHFKTECHVVFIRN